MIAKRPRSRLVDATVAVLGVALLAVSFGPWAARFDVTGTPRVVNAWLGPGIWALAVALGLAGAVLWLLRPQRLARAVSSAVALIAAALVVGYAPTNSFDHYGGWSWLGISLLAALAVLCAVSFVRGDTGSVHVALAVLTGGLIAISAFPWWGAGSLQSPWQASTVWTFTVAIVLIAAAAALVFDPRRVRLAAATAATAATAWAAAYSLPLPSLSQPPALPGYERRTVAIATFTAGPHVNRFHHGTTYYEVGGLWLMAAVSVALLAAAAAGFRHRAR